MRSMKFYSTLFLILLVVLSISVSSVNATDGIRVENRLPAHNAVINTALPEISCLVYNGTGGTIDVLRISATLDGSEIKLKFNWIFMPTGWSIQVIHKVQSLLAEGTHSVKIFYAGTQVSEIWEFKISNPVEKSQSETLTRRMDNLEGNFTNYRTDFEKFKQEVYARFGWVTGNLSQFNPVLKWWAENSETLGNIKNLIDLPTIVSTAMAGYANTIGLIFWFSIAACAISGASILLVFLTRRRLHRDLVIVYRDMMKAPKEEEPKRRKKGEGQSEAETSD